MTEVNNDINKKDERVDDLQRNGLSIIQNPKWFCFGIDAVLLSAFVQTKNKSIVADLGTGTGIIPLLLSLRSKDLVIHGFEIQKDVAEMAVRSIALNDLQGQIRIHPEDFKQASEILGKGTLDVVVSNPPYMAGGEGIHNLVPQKAISRHELLMNLEALFLVTHDLLKPGGAFYMIHRPSRMVDIFSAARAMRMEPKQIQFVHPMAGKKPNLMLIRFNKHGRKELKILDPIIVYAEKDQYTQQIYDIYKGVQIDAFEYQQEDSE